MFTNCVAASLEESAVVWMKKKSPSAILVDRGEAEIRLFLWPKERQFTVLEDFILKVIENDLGSSDEEIAHVLCLEPRDVGFIINYGDLKKAIEEDSSHRVLRNGFAREMLDGIAFVDEDETPPPEIEGGNKNRKELLEWMYELGRSTGRTDQSKERKIWMEENSARIIVLTISVFYYNNEQKIFSCDGKLVPSLLKRKLSKLEVFCKTVEKSIPPETACHRDEFWPWLKNRLREDSPETITFESAQYNKEAIEWLQAGNSVKIDHDSSTGHEAVSLDDERFELRGDFVCRVN